MIWLKANHKPLTQDDKMKYDVARELGLLEKIQNSGWGGLTAGESGKIGGILMKKKKEKNMQKQMHQE